MAGTMHIIVREMTGEDYDKVYDLWNSIQGFAIRAVDDSRENIQRFIKRNPTTSVVAEQNGRIVGSILCGHDGRQGYFYHVCVAKDYRKHGIGEKMAHFALQALQKEGINRAHLTAFAHNVVGNTFWQNIGWTFREDVNYYQYDLSHENTVSIVQTEGRK